MLHIHTAVHVQQTLHLRGNLVGGGGGGLVVGWWDAWQVIDFGDKLRST